MIDNVTVNFCPVCGDRVSSTENLCRKCNYDLNDYRAAISQTLTPTTEPLNDDSSERKSKKIFVGSLAAATFACIGLVKIFGASDAPPPAEPAATVQEEKIAPQPAEVPQAEEPAQILNEHWIKDADTDIYLQNPEPKDGESISWSGGFVQDGKYKFADGNGVVTWYRGGQVIQVDEGTFARGLHNGQFKHTFPSGRTVYSNWNHGEEIPLPSAAEEARQTFINYHRAITNGNYRIAYDTLAAEQQQRVGNFDDYAAGYANTLSSEVDDLLTVKESDDSVTLNYRLTARDKTPDGKVKVQLFDGQATLVKVDGRWLIVNARSQRVNQYVE